MPSQYPGGDLQELARRLKQNKSAPRLIIVAVITLLVLISLSSGFYKVDTEETGVLLRFGRFKQFCRTRPAFKAPLWHRSGLQGQDRTRPQGGVRIPHRPGRRTHHLHQKESGG